MAHDLIFEKTRSPWDSRGFEMGRSHRQCDYSIDYT